MTALNARANQAWAEYAEQNAEVMPEFTQEAFEEGWETGYKTAAGEAVERSQAFRGIESASATAETAEKIATVAEEFADDLEPPTTVEWLELRDWFKDQLHQVAARAREIGGVS